MNTKDEALLYEGMMAVAVKNIIGLPNDDQLLLINSRNESLLKASLVLYDSTELDEHDEIRLELKRQDIKIDLLLELVGELLIHQNLLPPEIPVSLTATSLSCGYCNPKFKKEVGETVEISLYISPGTPKALVIFGVILEAKEQCIIEFKGVSQNIRDWLEKFIFRHHRRLIAQRLHKSKSI